MEKLRAQFARVVSAVNRYPLVIGFLLLTAMLNIRVIHGDNSHYEAILYTFIIGAVVSAVAQQIYEHFFSGIKEKVMLYFGAIVFTIGYYFTIHLTSPALLEVEVKTGVLFLALMLVFIWIPSIKSDMSFDKTFMATLKAFFTMLLFTLVLTLGINLVIFAGDRLLVPVDGKVYSHVLNLIFTLFAPLFFLSLMPNYIGAKEIGTPEQQEEIEVATACPKLLAILLSYVVVPLAGIYTLILGLYVLLNIRSDFWTDNLLEPMLVAYSITIMLITILVARLEQPMASYYRKIVPKVLLPIVLLQLIASILKIGEAGITHGRYYVIMYGLFALTASVVFSFYSIKKSGWLAVFLIAFSVISVLPPVDAFTVSRVNQTHLLQKTLLENAMYEAGEIIPKESIDLAEKKKIIKTTRYLDRMGYVEEIDWLPDDVLLGGKFKQVFGFDDFHVGEDNEVVYEGKSSYLNREDQLVLDVAGYDRIVSLLMNDYERDDISVDLKGQSYRLVRGEGELTFTLSGEELIHVNMDEVFAEVLNKGRSLDLADATVVRENDKVRIGIVVSYADVYEDRYSGEVYLLLEVKE